MSWPVRVRLEDGSVHEFDTIDRAPLERVMELSGPAWPESEATVKVDPTRGERARRWQTQVIRLNSDEPPLSVSTFAIERDGQVVAYLYFPQDGSVILSSKELQWH